MPRLPTIPEESWFRRLAETTTTGIAIYRECFLWANPAMERITGYSPEELREMPFWATVHPDHRETVRERGRSRLAGKMVPSRYEVKIVRKDGRDRWIDFAAGVIQLEDGPAGIGTAVDITQRKQAEEALRREKERAQVTLSSIGDGVIRTDGEGRIDFLNPVAETLTGWRAPDALGQPLGRVYRVVDEATLQAVADPVERCLLDGKSITLPGDRLLVHRDGSSYPVQDSASPLRDGRGAVAGAVLVFRDLSAVRRMQQEMRHLAVHDPLTGLPNREAFQEELEEAVDEARRGSVHTLAYLILSDLKLVNDTCGYAAGDAFIRETGRILSTHLDAVDTLARVREKEFALLLRNRGAEESLELAETLLEALGSERFAWEDRLFSLRANLGLVAVDGKAESSRTLLSAADTACQMAVESGPNRIHLFRPEDTAMMARHGQMQWISRIHRALEEDRLELFQQPIIALGPSDEPANLCEVLVRIRNRRGELQRPGLFIPAAERFHLVAEIDRWVIARAFEHLAGCLERGETDMHIAVNLSGQSLSQEAILNQVINRLEATGVPPSRVLFEITETAAIADLPQAMHFIYVLRGMGCRFVLDDFGKGLSSVAYLRNLSVDFLKIDGSFVHAAVEDPTQLKLVRSIHEMGEVLKIRTIAEAVETREMLEAMRGIGVDFAQGNYVAQPRPLDSTLPLPWPAF